MRSHFRAFLHAFELPTDARFRAHLDSEFLILIPIPWTFLGFILQTTYLRFIFQTCRDFGFKSEIDGTQDSDLGLQGPSLHTRHCLSGDTGTWDGSPSRYVQYLVSILFVFLQIVYQYIYIIHLVSFCFLWEGLKLVFALFVLVVK